MGTTQPIKDLESLEKFKNYYYEKNRIRNYALIIVGLNTALRISDILKLKWENVYWFSEKSFRKHIQLIEGKTKKKSIVAMNPAVIDAFSMLRAQDFENCFPDRYIFTSNKRHDQSMCRTQAYRIIRTAAVACGIEETISCHSLRKTFGYHAWKHGVPPAVLMNIFNHSSYQITKRYLGIEQDDRDDVFLSVVL